MGKPNLYFTLNHWLVYRIYAQTQYRATQYRIAAKQLNSTPKQSQSRGGRTS